MIRVEQSRRLFLRQAGMVSLLGAGAAPLALNLAALGSAAAQTAVDYRALVCVFLYGGNDSFNTVLATDAPSWANYTTIRNQAPDPIALAAPGVAANLSASLGTPARLGGVLPITPLRNQRRGFALHPVMGSLQGLFNGQRRLAVVANVGPLKLPTSKAQYANVAHPRPPKLFSHNDQQSVWQSFAPEGGNRGWGGRMADMLMSSNAAASFVAVSAAGQTVWLSGQSAQAYQVTSSGALRLGVDSNGTLYRSASIGAALQRVASSSRSGNLLEADYAAMARRSLDTEAVLRSVLASGSDARWGTPATNYSVAADPKLQYLSPLGGGATANALAQQFQVVARMIDAGMALGNRRQVFFVGLGGFDVHNTQNTSHADLLAKLSQAMGYFDTTLGAMGLRDKVTTFTASDFGRTFTSNGDGTDHGWGAHHLVMGAGVIGGDIYGRFPVLGAKNLRDNNFDASADQLLNGVLLPEIAVDQYAATLGHWFGLNEAQQLDVLPNLSGFDAVSRNLGFML